MSNLWISEAKALYAELVADQEERAEAYAIGYDTELADFYREVEPRITFGEVLQRLSREWRAREHVA